MIKQKKMKQEKKDDEAEKMSRRESIKIYFKLLVIKYKDTLACIFWRRINQQTE